MENKGINNSTITQLKLIAQKAGARIIYKGLLLYYAYNRQETPVWAKNIILGTIGYLISPIDLIPDLTPFLGFTDDLGVLVIGISTISLYINDEVRKRAKDKLLEWIPEYDHDQISEIDKEIENKS